MRIDVGIRSYKSFLGEPNAHAWLFDAVPAGKCTVDPKCVPKSGSRQERRHPLPSRNPVQTPLSFDLTKCAFIKLTWMSIPSDKSTERFASNSTVVLQLWCRHMTLIAVLCMTPPSVVAASLGQLMCTRNSNYLFVTRCILALDFGHSSHFSNNVESVLELW